MLYLFPSRTQISLKEFQAFFFYTFIGFRERATGMEDPSVYIQLEKRKGKKGGLGNTNSWDERVEGLCSN